MAKEIWKFPLVIKERQVITVPAHAKILALQLQDETPCIWALVDPTYARKPRTFHMYETGQVFPEGREADTHIGTVQVDNGRVMYHVFEEYE